MRGTGQDEAEPLVHRVRVVVIGAGQAGLSSAYHLVRRGLAPHRDFVVLDANDGPGGAWRHRWDSLTMADVHGVADLPGVPAPDHGSAAPANVTAPAYFADYEQRFMGIPSSSVTVFPLAWAPRA